MYIIMLNVFPANYATSDFFTEQVANLLNTNNSLSGKTLSAACFDTPLGAMFAVADDQQLFLLQFADFHRLPRDVEKLKRRENATLRLGKTTPINAIEKELAAYFKGNLKSFTTPLYIEGSSFQKQVWEALIQIPYGLVKSYSEQADALGKPTAYRAVANANGANQFVIIIPCHRIINHNGNLGGYGGGIERKQWLLAHEQAHSK